MTKHTRMTTFTRPQTRRTTPYGTLFATAVFFLSGVFTSQAAITLTADPMFPGFPDVFTVNPSGLGTSAHGFTEARMLRQTFTNAETFDIGQLVISLDLNGTDGNSERRWPAHQPL